MKGFRSATFLGLPAPLVAVTMFQFAIGGSVLPFIAFHLKDEGFTYGEIGRIFFTGSASSLIFPLLWGFLSDRYIPLNRLFLLLNFLAGCFLIKLYQAEGLLAHQFLFACYYAFYHPTIILINSLCFHHLPNPSMQFGKIRGLGSLGWMIPSLPLFLLFFYARQVPTGFCLYVAAGIAFANVFLCLLLPHTPTARSRRAALPPAGLLDPEKKDEYFHQLGVLGRDRRFICLMLSLFFGAASFSIVALFSTPYLEELGVDRAYAGPIQCIGVITEVILMPLLPVFFLRFGYVNGMFFGLVSLLIRQLLSYFWPDALVLSLSYVFVGLMVIYYFTVVSMALERLADKVVRSTAQTFMVMLGSGLGPMSANLIAGYLAGKSDGADYALQPVFGFGGLLALVSLACLVPVYMPLRRFLDPSIMGGFGGSRRPSSSIGE